MKKNKLHIVHTHPKNIGGVANHYRGLKDCWPIKTSSSIVGSRFNVSGLFFFPFDLFLMIIKSRSTTNVLLNPSMQPKAFWRDYILLLVLIFLKKKVTIFFHGWDMRFAEKVLKRENVIYFLNKCKVITLASKFNRQLKSFKVNNLFLSTTKFDESLLKCSFNKNLKSEKFTILFVGRLVKSKGLSHILESVANSKYKNKFKIIVAGDGPDKDFFINYSKKLGMCNLTDFKGYVRDCDLAQLYKISDLYILPTSHDEGMPTTILEALAFGLPIVSTIVGGIPDIIKNKINGALLSENFTNDELKNYIEYFYLNPKKRSLIKENNLKLSKRFRSKNVAKQITEIIFV